MFQTEDMIKQHELLNQVAQLIDAGTLMSTLKDKLGNINAKNLKKAHAQIEIGNTIGKIVLEGFWIKESIYKFQFLKILFVDFR